MNDAPFHLTTQEILAIREERLGTPRRLRATLHLARCTDCVGLAKALPPAEDGPPGFDPVALALRRLADSWAWPVLGAAHVAVLDRVEKARWGFLHVLVEEAVVLAIYRQSIDVFSLPVVAAEICSDLVRGEEAAKLLRRTLIRRGYAAAVLGLSDLASKSLTHAMDFETGVEDAGLDIDLLEASGRWRRSMGQGWQDKYVSARHYAEGSGDRLREIELRLMTVCFDDLDERKRSLAIEALEQAENKLQKIPRSDSLRRRAALLLVSSFAADLTAKCLEQGLEPLERSVAFIRRLESAKRWFRKTDAWTRGRCELSLGHLLGSTDAAAAQKSYLRSIDAYTRVEAGEMATRAFLGLVQLRRLQGENIDGATLGRLFIEVERQLTKPLYYRFMTLIETARVAKETKLGEMLSTAQNPSTE